MEIHPLTPDRWSDLVDLFGPNGAYSGCWCMWNRQTNAEFEQHHGDDNRQALRRLTDAGPPGLLGYEDGVAVGWVSLGPYEDFSRLARSPVARPVDEAPVWAITCFVVRKGWRGTGVASAMLEAAADHARSQGATMVEGYPLDPAGTADNAAAWMGLASMFATAGFVEVARRKPTRPVMRKEL